MVAVSSRGTVAGLDQRTGRSRLHKPGSRKGVVALYGAGSDLDTFFAFDDAVGWLSPVCEAGHPIGSITVGQKWGNAQLRSEVLQLYANVRDKLFQPPRFHMYGISAGGLTSFNFAFNYPDMVQSITAVIPALCVQDLYDTNRGGFAAAISTAYGGRPSDADDPTRHPEFYRRFPVRIYYSETDTVCLAEQTEEFAERSGAELISMGSIGHSAGSPFSGDAVAAFIQANDEPWRRRSDPISRLFRSMRPAIYLPLDYRSGDRTTTADLVGGYTATLQGDIETGTEDQAVIPRLATEFDGTDDYITTDWSPFVAGDVVAVSGLANRYDNTARHTLFGGSTVALAIESGSNDVKFWPNTGGSPVTWSDAWPGSERWVSFDLTFDDSANTVKLRINGRLVSEQACSTAYSSPGSFRVGAYGSGTSPFQGAIAHIAGFSRSIKQSESRAIAKATRRGMIG